jgi:hypothetical protein
MNKVEQSGFVLVIVLLWHFWSGVVVSGSRLEKYLRQRCTDQSTMASSTFMCQDKYFDFEDFKLKNRILNYFLVFCPKKNFVGKKNSRLWIPGYRINLFLGG